MEADIPTAADYANANASAALHNQRSLEAIVARHEAEIKELRKVILHLVNTK